MILKMNSVLDLTIPPIYKISFYNLPARLKMVKIIIHPSKEINFLFYHLVKINKYEVESIKFRTYATRTIPPTPPY
jgi:hypothetical protein